MQIILLQKKSKFYFIFLFSSKINLFLLELMKCNLCVRGLAHVIQRVSSSSLSANDTTNPDKNLVIDKSSNSHLKGVIKPPHYRSTSGTFRGTHMLNEEFVVCYKILLNNFSKMAKIF